MREDITFLLCLSFVLGIAILGIADCHHASQKEAIHQDAPPPPHVYPNLGKPILPENVGLPTCDTFYLHTEGHICHMAFCKADGAGGPTALWCEVELFP